MDDEYQRAITAAELAWLTGVIEDLRTGTLTWNYEMFAELAANMPGTDVVAKAQTDAAWPG